MILRIRTCVNDYALLTDTEVRKCGEQIGLETLVVHAVNSECCNLIVIFFKYYLDFQANAISTPPEEYDRKIGTQRN